MSRHPSANDKPALDYLKSSPVRGQLEPQHSKTAIGWRYIQTTDTLDELKVLLPPGTASMYEQLLKFENYELSKKTSVAWERILEIRHLKDRMIRKCQKLAKTIPPASTKLPRGDTFAFQTFVAPSDFRVKEMERWFRDQHKRVSAITRRPSAPARTMGFSNPYGCSHCTIDAHGRHTTSHTGVSHHPVASSSKNVLLHAPAIPTVNPGRAPSSKPRPASQTVLPQRTKSLPVKTITALTSPPVASVSSPRPLPILLRGQREEYGLEEPVEVSSPPVSSDEALQEEAEAEAEASPTGNGPQEVVPGRPGLHRRRSCIRRNSIDGISKTVSWADDQEWDQQLSQFTSAARALQSSDKWEEVRGLYLEQVNGLQNLHIQIQEGIDNLRSETEHLLRIDDTIRTQREALHTTFQEFEGKHTLLQEKVQEVLQEAGDVLSRNNGVAQKTELQAIEES